MHCKSVSSLQANQGYHRFITIQPSQWVSLKISCKGNLKKKKTKKEKCMGAREPEY